MVIPATAIIQMFFGNQTRVYHAECTCFWVSLNKLESVIVVQLRGGFIKAGALPELLQSVTDLKTFYYW